MAATACSRLLIVCCCRLGGTNEGRNGSKEADSDRCNDEWNGKIRAILSLGNRANSPDRQTPSNGLGALFFP